MAEATQISFTLTEVAKLLLRQQGIKQGRWSLGFELGLAVGAFGANEADSKPGAMLQIGGLNLARVPDENPPSTASYVVDAATLED
jgi:hypothetical protein